MTKSLRRDQSHSTKVHFLPLLASALVSSPKKKVSKLLRQKEKAQSKLQRFSFTETLVSCESQMKDEIVLAQTWLFSGLDGGWGVKDRLLLGYSCVSFPFFTLKTMFGGKNKQWFQCVQPLNCSKEKPMTLQHVCLFSFLSVSGCMPMPEKNK